MAIKFTRFNNLLYVKFVHEKAYRVEDVARRMNISASTFYNYIEGLSTFPPDLIAPLYNATGDVEFLNFTLNDTNKMATDRAPSTAVKSLLQEVLEAAAAGGNMVGLVNEAVSDGRISDIERRQIDRALDATISEIEDVRRSLG